MRFWGRGSAWRTGPPGTNAAAWRPYRNSFRRGAEARSEAQQDSRTCMPVQGQVTVALLTKNSEAKNTLKEREDLTQHCSQAAGRAEWRILVEPSVRVAGSGLEGRS